LANAPIQDPSGWISILRRLGITGLRSWYLADVVVPVALVDSEITLTAIAEAQLLGTPASAGELAAPAANTRLADTGPQNVGNYAALIWMGISEANSLRVRRRNAADAGDVWSFRLPMAINSTFVLGPIRIFLAQGERLVVENITAGAGGSVYQAALFFGAG